MLPIKHILAPIDFSERSEAAAAEAARLSDLFDAELTLLHVGPSVQLDHSYRSEAEVDKSEKTQLEASRRLEGKLKGVGARIAPKATTILAEGDPAARIEEYVKNHAVDLLVMATHGLGTFRRYLLGSLTSKILHDLEIPIATGAHLEAADPFPASTTNVGCAIGLQDPDDSKRILTWAGDLAELVGAKLTVIHVPQVVDPGSMFAAETREALEEKAARDIAEMLSDAGLEADVIVKSGHPMETIVEQITESNCNALVIGRTAQHGLFRVGHADGYAVIRQSPAPVFSV